MRVTLTSSALAALLMLTACDQNPANQSAQNTPNSQLQSDQTARNDQTTSEQPGPSSGTMDQTGPMHTAGIPINEVQDPKLTLAKASVKDSKGEAVGEVKSVSLDPAGKLQAVNVSIGSKTVALNASGLTYMQAENTIVSPQSKDEIQNMK